LKIEQIFNPGETSQKVSLVQSQRILEQISEEARKTLKVWARISLLFIYNMIVDINLLIQNQNI
jgi:hypothetical protein